MFDLGWSELIVVAMVMILVVGPKELPSMLRTMGRALGSLRRMAADFQRQFNEALQDAELDEIKNTIDSVKKFNPAQSVKKSFNPPKPAVKNPERGPDEAPALPAAKDEAEAAKAKTAAKGEKL